jgi:2-iminobutanoate/2-iminopropanoate deaminase
MINHLYDIGIASQIGTYSDAVLVPAHARWLFTAGTPGLAVNGELPDDITGQAEIAWGHIAAMLKQADMDMHDVVKVTQYLRREADIGPYARVRARFLGDARPGSMLLIVPGLVRPEFLLEIEVCAAKP